MGPGKIREFNKLPFYGIVLEILGAGGNQNYGICKCFKMHSSYETGAHGVIRWKTRGEN